MHASEETDRTLARMFWASWIAGPLPFLLLTVARVEAMGPGIVIFGQILSLVLFPAYSLMVLIKDEVKSRHSIVVALAAFYFVGFWLAACGIGFHWEGSWSSSPSILAMLAAGLAMPVVFTMFA